MVSKGTTLLDLALGASIGERAGWSTQRVEALRIRKDAIMQLALERGMSAESNNQFSCEAINQSNAFMLQWARNGELRAHEEELERSGRTTTELAQVYRQHLESIRRDAQERGAAASR